ncbi:hypothetical protein J3F84DRAFT_380231, partial [Trichoderma pleuroticola]
MEWRRRRASVSLVSFMVVSLSWSVCAGSGRFIRHQTLASSAEACSPAAKFRAEGEWCKISFQACAASGHASRTRQQDCCCMWRRAAWSCLVHTTKPPKKLAEAFSRVLPKGKRAASTRI